MRACDGFTYSELREVKMAFNLANPEKQDLHRFRVAPLDGVGP